MKTAVLNGLREPAATVWGRNWIAGKAPSPILAVRTNALLSTVTDGFVPASRTGAPPSKTDGSASANRAIQPTEREQYGTSSVPLFER